MEDKKCRFEKEDLKYCCETGAFGKEMENCSSKTVEELSDNKGDDE